MLDVVANHLGAYWRDFDPTNAGYGPFSEASDFHPLCFIQDYSNQTEVEQCWIGKQREEFALADLNTEKPKVVQELYKWVNWLVNEYEVDGLRVDTVKHGEHGAYSSRSSSSSLFCQSAKLSGLALKRLQGSSAPAKCWMAVSDE